MSFQRQHLALAGLAMLALVITTAPPFYINLVTYIGLYSIVALGLVLLTGVAGVTSLGQAAFVGIGAYATATMTVMLGLSPWAGLLAALLLSGLCAFLLGLITFRLSGHYLALGTMAWGLGLFYIMGNIAALGGHTGIPGVPQLPLAWLYAGAGRGYSALVWCVTLLLIVATERILASRKGRAIRALKETELMAQSTGVNTYMLKMQIFVLTGLAAGLSGWLYAHYIGFVNPTPFGIYFSIEYLFMAVLGGAGYVWGAVIGATVITVLKHSLQDYLPMLLGRTGNFEIVVLGGILMFVLHRAKEGIAPFLARFVKSETLQVPTHVVDTSPQRSIRSEKAGNILRVDNVTRRFGGLVAVNALNFEMREGEILGLIGPNGAGKSTTFNLITNVLAPSSGHIHFRSQRLDGIGMQAVARLGITRSFQHVQIVHDMSVLENVALGGYLNGHNGLIQAALGTDRSAEQTALARAARQIARVGLGDKMHDAAGSLALGQQRLIEVARALMAEPALLLLDEPAAGLRHLEKQELAALLHQLRSEGISVLLVEHDMDFVMSLVDRLVVMNFGQKLAEGTPDEIRCNPDVIEAYLGAEDA